MIFLIGYHASGKTEMANILCDQFQMRHFETSAIVRNFKAQTAPDLSMSEWAESIEQCFGPHFLNDLIIQAIQEELAAARQAGVTYQDMVITGNRSFDYGVSPIISALISRGEPFLRRRNVHIIAVLADEEPLGELHVLHSRYTARARDIEDADLSFEKFLTSIILPEDTSGLRELLEMAHIRIVNNATSWEDLQLCSRSILRMLGYRPRKLTMRERWRKLTRSDQDVATYCRKLERDWFKKIARKQQLWRN